MGVSKLIVYNFTRARFFLDTINDHVLQIFPAYLTILSNGRWSWNPRIYALHPLREFMTYKPCEIKKYSQIWLKSSRNYPVYEMETVISII